MNFSSSSVEAGVLEDDSFVFLCFEFPKNFLHPVFSKFPSLFASMAEVFPVWTGISVV